MKRSVSVTGYAVGRHCKDITLPRYQRDKNECPKEQQQNPGAAGTEKIVLSGFSL